MTAAPSVDEVRQIAALDDPVIRNLRITDCYGRLAAAVAAECGEGANWCTFATWASRQAGVTIRGEDLLDEVRRRLRRERWLLHPFATFWRRLLRRGLLRPETRIGRLVAELHTPFDAVELASACVARGNLKVFAEIGLEFARWLEECGPDAAPGAFDRFAAGLRDGDPPDGQRLLRQAFARYERLRDEHDPDARVQVAVLANLEIGLHEQTRLEPEILAAMDAATVTQEDLGHRALVALFPDAPRLWAVVRRPLEALVGVPAAALQRGMSRLARELVTESFMVLSLPGRVLALGANLADPYPEALREPTDEELVALRARFEPVPPAPDDCGARDWSDFDERMHYILHLFCAFHLDAKLAQPPFTPQQAAAIRRGELPGGEL